MDNLSRSKDTGPIQGSVNVNKNDAVSQELKVLNFDVQRKLAETLILPEINEDGNVSEAAKAQIRELFEVHGGILSGDKEAPVKEGAKAMTNVLYYAYCGRHYEEIIGFLNELKDQGIILAHDWDNAVLALEGKQLEARLGFNPPKASQHEGDLKVKGMKSENTSRVVLDSVAGFFKNNEGLLTPSASTKVLKLLENGWKSHFIDFSSIVDQRESMHPVSMLPGDLTSQSNGKLCPNSILYFNIKGDKGGEFTNAIVLSEGYAAPVGRTREVFSGKPMLDGLKVFSSDDDQMALKRLMMQKMRMLRGNEAQGWYRKVGYNRTAARYLQDELKPEKLSKDPWTTAKSTVLGALTLVLASESNIQLNKEAEGFDEVKALDVYEEAHHVYREWAYADRLKGLNEYKALPNAYPDVIARAELQLFKYASSHMSPEALRRKIDDNELRGPDAIRELFKAAYPEDKGEDNFFDACLGGNLRLLENLKDIGFDLSKQSLRGDTLFHRLVRNNKPELFEFASDLADVNAKDKTGRTPLVLAFDRKYYDIAKILITQCNADANVMFAQNVTLLGWAVATKQADFIQWLLDAGANFENIPLGANNTIEGFAQDMIFVLADKGVRPDLVAAYGRLNINWTKPDTGGYEPLHRAFVNADPARNQGFDVVKVIIELGAPVDTVNAGGRTFINWLARDAADGSAILGILKLAISKLPRDYDMSQKSPDGTSALDQARNEGNTEAVRLIEEYLNK